MNDVKQVSPEETANWHQAGTAMLIDVREVDEHAKECIEGAVLIPLSAFTTDDLPQDKRLVVHCLGGKRGAQAANKLVERGFEDVCNLDGGLMGWKKAGLATSA